MLRAAGWCLRHSECPCPGPDTKRRGNGQLKAELPSSAAGDRPLAASARGLGRQHPLPALPARRPASAFTAQLPPRATKSLLLLLTAHRRPGHSGLTRRGAAPCCASAALHRTKAQKPPQAGELPVTLQADRAPPPGSQGPVPSGPLLLGSNSPGARASPPGARPQPRCRRPARHPALPRSACSNALPPRPSVPRRAPHAPALRFRCGAAARPDVTAPRAAAPRTRPPALPGQLRGSPAPPPPGERRRGRRQPLRVQERPAKQGKGAPADACPQRRHQSASPQLAPNGLCPFGHLERRQQQRLRSGSNPPCPTISVFQRILHESSPVATEAAGEGNCPRTPPFPQTPEPLPGTEPYTRARLLGFAGTDCSYCSYGCSQTRCLEEGSQQ